MPKKPFKQLLTEAMEASQDVGAASERHARALQHLKLFGDFAPGRASAQASVDELGRRFDSAVERMADAESAAIRRWDSIRSARMRTGARA